MDAHHRVHLPLNLGPLTRCPSRVHNNLRIPPRHAHDTNHPLSIPNHRSPQQHRRKVNRAFERSTVLARPAIEDFNGSVVGKHVNVGLFGADDELRAFGEVGRGAEVGELGNG